MEPHEEQQYNVPPRQERKLYKSTVSKVIDGVCGGIGEYLGINPLWIRIVWILLTLNSGLIPGLVLYIVAAIAIPKGPDGSSEELSPGEPVNITPLITIVGSLLIVIGLYFLLYNFNLIPVDLIAMTKYYIKNAFFPILLIVIGVLLIIYRGKK